MPLPLLIQQVLASAGLFVAFEEPVANEPLKPVYVQIEVMLDELRVVPCRIETSGAEGAGYDQAALDLDGDGKFETIVAGEKDTYDTGNDRFGFNLPLVLGDAEFNVELRGSQADPTSGRTYLYWTLNRGGTYLFFINGQVEMHGAAEAAAAGKALRLGPPFHFETRSTTRGPDALVNVGLKDANGSTLRIARTAENTESQIHLTFAAEGRRGTPIAAEYG